MENYGKNPGWVDWKQVEHLIREIRNHSHDAEVQLVALIRPWVLRIVRRWRNGNGLRKDVGSEDVLQEFWIRLLAMIHDHSNDISRIRYSFSTVIRRYLIDLSRRAHDAKLPSSLEVPDGQTSPRSRFIREEQAERALEALEDLTEEHRRIVEAIVFLELNYSEVAREFGMTRRAVAKMFTRAMGQIRKKLDD